MVFTSLRETCLMSVYVLALIRAVAAKFISAGHLLLLPLFIRVPSHKRTYNQVANIQEPTSPAELGVTGDLWTAPLSHILTHIHARTHKTRTRHCQECIWILWSSGLKYGRICIPPLCSHSKNNPSRRLSQVLPKTHSLLTPNFVPTSA